MLLKEAIDKLKKKGYKVLNEEMYEKEYLDQLRTRILKFAEESNYTVDEEQLEAIMFEAYNNDMELDQAFDAVWKAIYVQEGESTKGVVE